MKPTVKLLITAAMLPFIACSRDGTEDEEYCLRESYKIPISVHVELGHDTVFREYKTIDSLYLKTRGEEMMPYLKYYVAAFPMTEGVPTAVASSTKKDVNMSLHPGRYTMVGWVMYETGEKSRGFNFYDDDLSELLLKNKYSYTGANPYKIAYRASEPKNLAYNTTDAMLTAKPAMGYYRIIATDSAEFVPSKVVLRYTSMLPASIHGKTGAINWWWNDIGYTSEIVSLDSIGDLLAHDFILAQDTKELPMKATIEVYDEHGTLKARKKNIEIPLKNGGITTIKGDFYSFLEVDEDGTSGSGISIKTEWDAIFDIEI